jgi:hypothetical protein
MDISPVRAWILNVLFHLQPISQAGVQGHPAIAMMAQGQAIAG